MITNINWNDVMVANQLIRRPQTVSPSQWLAFWELMQKVEFDHVKRYRWGRYA